MTSFDPEEFVKASIGELRRNYGGISRVLAAVSGGVDSVTSAVLVYKALGDVVKAVFIDTGFMRINEGLKVRDMLSNLLPLEIVDRSGRFYDRLQGLADAEVKRKVFRDLFYEVIGELVREFKCEYIVQGTIAADWIETLSGIKTQHNVLSSELLARYGLKVIEPLRNLFKDQVRLVAEYLGIPSEIVRRQPFPGPGLLVRTVGEFRLDKLRVLQRATEVVESYLGKYGISQYFPAIWEYKFLDKGRLCRDLCIDYRIFNVMATGVRDGKRVYEPVLLVEGAEGQNITNLYRYFEGMGVSHIVLLIRDKGYGKYFISIRAIITRDFMTADVYPLQLERLKELADKLLMLDEVRAVGYDVTPKPPATIEYE